MNPLVLAGLLAALIVVPLALIAVFFLIGMVFSAPKRFGTVLFVVLFLIALAATAFGYLRAGQVSAATVTGVSERVVVDDALRARHEFKLTVTLADLGSRTISVPARIFDRTRIGDQIDIRSASVLGLKLARPEGERITDLIPLGSLVCAVLVVLFTSLATASARARAPAILLALAALVGVGVQPAINALPSSGSEQVVTATGTGVTSVNAAAAPTIRAAAYLRGPFSIDQRWMWMNDADLRFVAVQFTPAAASSPVTAVDVVPDGSTVAAGEQVQVRYQTQNPRRITLENSQATQCARILLGILGAAEALLLLIGAVIWRLRARRRHRQETKQIDLGRDVNRAIELSTRREGQPNSGDGDPPSGGRPAHGRA